MRRLSEARRRVLAEVDDAAQSWRISKRLSQSRVAVSATLQWAKRNGLVTYDGMWRTTPAGRLALSNQEPSDEAQGADHG